MCLGFIVFHSFSNRYSLIGKRVGTCKRLDDSKPSKGGEKLLRRNQKGLASAINLFMIVWFTLGFYLQMYLLRQWRAGFLSMLRMPQIRLKSQKPTVESDISNSFWILFFIILVKFSVLFNLLPPVKNWVESVMSNALDATTRRVFEYAGRWGLRRRQRRKMIRQSKA